MHTLYPDEWYLRYTCVKCGSKQILFPDLSKGTGTIRGFYVVTCSQCQNKASYDIEHIERYHYPADRSCIGQRRLVFHPNQMKWGAFSELVAWSALSLFDLRGTGL